MAEQREGIPVEVPSAAKVLRTRVFAALYRGLREPERITSLSFRLLRAMGNHPLVRMIIERRKAQAVAYCHPPRYRGDAGFDIILAEEQRSLRADEEQRRDEIIKLLLHGGVIWPRPADGRPGAWAGDGRTPALPLPQAVAMLVEDSLIFDSAGLLLQKGRNKERWPVAWFRPVDGSRIRLADPEFYTPEYRRGVKLVEYVVLDRNNRPMWELAWDEFAYWVRNPSTDEESLGYGRSELEYAVDILTGLVTSFRYNVSQFTENRLPPGILAVPEVDERILDEFLTTLEMNVGGAAGHWRAIPVIAVSGDKPQVQWIPLGDRPGDMQWRDFIIFCINVLCSLYKISPEEVGFQSYLTRQATLQEADPETRILHGQDTGFVPLMESLASFINEHIVGKFDGGKWRFVWRELGRENEARAADLRSRRLSMGFTSIDEERAWADKPLRRLPTDVNLWMQCQRKVLKSKPLLVRDPDALWEATELIYAASGGTFSLATQVPVNAQALQIYHIEQMQLGEAQEGGAQGAGGGGMDLLQQLQQGIEEQPGAAGPEQESWTQREDEHEREEKSLQKSARKSAGKRIIEVHIRRG